MLAVLLLNSVTAVIGVLTGILCLLKRSKFPDTRSGYHVKEAAAGEPQWNYYNRTAGTLSLWCALLCFVLLPVALFLLGVSSGWMLGIYFAAAVLYILAVVFWPACKLRKKK